MAKKEKRVTGLGREDTRLQAKFARLLAREWYERVDHLLAGSESSAHWVPSQRCIQAPSSGKRLEGKANVRLGHFPVMVVAFLNSESTFLDIS